MFIAPYFYKKGGFNLNCCDKYYSIGSSDKAHWVVFWSFIQDYSINSTKPADVKKSIILKVNKDSPKTNCQYVTSPRFQTFWLVYNLFRSLK